MQRPGVWAAAAASLTAVVITVATSCSTPPASGPGPAAGASSMITSTTKIAGAGVLGNDRRPDESCAPEPAAPDPGPPTRPVRHAAGQTDVPADPQRIVVLSGDALDFVCALGLQSRIVGAALAGEGATQPWYLGTVVHQAPAVGTRTAPDVAAVRAARPDLIIGSEALAPQSYAALADVAPTVFTGAPGAAWQDNLRLVGAATARVGATDRLLEGFRAQAERVGADNDAAHFQASIVELTEDTVRVYGADNFPASVLAGVGVERPPAQRFTDAPYHEIGSTDLATADFRAAEGDIVYVSFASPAARARGAAVLDSDAWRQLSANRDNRVFAVNNEVWQTGQGIVAARGVLADLRWLNAPIN
ncbi:iron-siderophore ABC transporter substrate-binding protein [Mycobacterium sp. MYCO198283]|uniref:iron-siderophore ABC transporter substrate-binding protein n=1 Tax=Mycobacterium sp. MYCO198283 TaxID=2883505 RepID=UPI001E412568|nr:iron-siderophore ABC transporter substrate-binding protein [Mycobacterium sp. MYCO198283]MCG5434350.1 iron-siderophore ABC transporter substrate-binding protein [Mycobacterium sp. MYCO198283]